MNLSASSLGVFENCARCFWFDKVKKNPRPRGIFPSLPGGMDRVLKEWADGLRSRSGIVPTLMTDKGQHKLFADAITLKKWQNWRSGLKWQDGNGNTMIGALDDVLVNAAGQYVPFDYKTKGSETNQADVEKYYQRQIDIYALLLGTVGKAADYGFILNHSPGEIDEMEASGDTCVTLKVQTFCLSADPKRAQDLFRRALLCVQSEIAPPSSPDCEYCKFIAERVSL